MEMYDKKENLETTFNENNLSEPLLQAQWAEFIELKKAISELFKRKGSPLRLLDIGIGDARILKHLVGIKELWDAIEQYDGIDVAQNCIDASTKVIRDLKIEKKVNVQLLDAVKIKNLKKKYDLIMCTWFTAGNFYPSNFDFEKFKPGYDMTRNENFTLIFKQAYDLLNSGGEIIIGSMYLERGFARTLRVEPVGETRQ